MSDFDPKSLPDYAARMEAARLYEAYAKLDDAKAALEQQSPPPPMDDINAAGDACQDAFNAYEACGLELLMDDYGNVVFCALTGVPLLADDSDWMFVLKGAAEHALGPMLPAATWKDEECPSAISPLP